MAVLALDSKKQNPRLLSQKKKPRWWPTLSAVKGALVSLTDVAVMSEEVKCAADTRGGHDPALEGCCRTGNHLPCAGMEEECPSVV